ncbi:L-type lectin-domain containing receptor kinase IV.1 [Acorus gramineus]|uniref:non-specific serine/threonine protein kinase n=1 Tax=Acorus gramineus TaxID=55184 RepID=A0AAV9B0M2_ACOGR|nr:L-type lectin-domain containing receptor kinase IV.1 [Acorus gramineus]
MATSTTPSSSPLLFFLLLLISTTTQSNSTQFTFNGFRGATNLTLDGISSITPDRVLLLTNFTPHATGHAFYHSPVPALSAFFSTTFVFAIIDNGTGGHGFAFTISPTNRLIGQPGPNLGLFTKANDGNASNHILAVEFNTDKIGMGDFNNNYIGVDINSIRSNTSRTASYFTRAGKTEPVSLESGSPIQVWIDYDSATGVLNVTISPTSVPKPSWPLMSGKFNFSEVLLESMYVGFSSATGKSMSYHCILGWSFSTDGVPTSSLDLSSLPSPPELPNQTLNLKSTATLKTGVISAIATLLSVVLIIAVAIYIRRKSKLAETLEAWELECPHRFRYKDLYKATNGFKDKGIIGHGGFGCVYKGVMPGSRESIAIKKISNSSNQGTKEFVAEISSLGRLRHRNLVNLLGWCKRGQDLLLVYEYMPNGSLDSWLFDTGEMRRRVLDWDRRLRVLRGIAAGLVYLHEEWEQVVVHRDVKASNVLLDGEMNARLGDFGLARLYEHGKDMCTTRVVGTLGYIAPELSRTGKATTSTDVYAFGGMLLEVACGRRPIEPSAAAGNLVLLDWVRECWMRGRIIEAADPALRGGGCEKWEVEMVLRLGLACSQSAPEARPTMRQVVHYLNGDEVLPDVVPVFDDKDSVEFASSRLNASSSSFGLMSTTGSLRSGG